MFESDAFNLVTKFFDTWSTHQLQKTFLILGSTHQLQKIETG